LLIATEHGQFTSIQRPELPETSSTRMDDFLPSLSDELNESKTLPQSPKKAGKAAKGAKGKKGKKKVKKKKGKGKPKTTLKAFLKKFLPSEVESMDVESLQKRLETCPSFSIAYWTLKLIKARQFKRGT
jgi:hypothetical protein